MTIAVAAVAGSGSGQSDPTKLAAPILRDKGE